MEDLILKSFIVIVIVLLWARFGRSKRHGYAEMLTCTVCGNDYFDVTEHEKADIKICPVCQKDHLARGTVSKTGTSSKTGIVQLPPERAAQFKDHVNNLKAARAEEIKKQ